MGNHQQVLLTDLICCSIIDVCKPFTFNVGHKILFKETFQKSAADFNTNCSSTKREMLYHSRTANRTPKYSRKSTLQPCKAAKQPSLKSRGGTVEMIRIPLASPSLFTKVYLASLISVLFLTGSHRCCKIHCDNDTQGKHFWSEE